MAQKGIALHDGESIFAKMVELESRLSSIEKQKSVANNFLTEVELIEWLHISREAVLKFRKDPEDPIPFLMAGRRYLYEPTEIVKWMRRQAQRKMPKTKPKRLRRNQRKIAERFV